MTPGALLSRQGIITASGLKDISKLLIYAIYPCLIFASITENFTLPQLFGATILPISSAMIMITGYVVGLIASLFINFKNDKQKHAFLFQNTINNYSFLPIAIVAEVFGAKAVAALIFSTLGAEITVWTLGVFIISGHKLDKQSLKHLVSPPLVALYLALIWLAVFQITGVSSSLYTENNSVLYYFHKSIKSLGSATIPLAMVIAGARLAKLSFSSINKGINWIATLLRLVITPIFAVLILKMLPLTDQWLGVMFVVAAMPVSLLSTLMAEIYSTDDDLINSTVLLTHLLSLLTIPLLLAILL